MRAFIRILDDQLYIKLLAICTQLKTMRVSFAGGRFYRCSWARFAAAMPHLAPSTRVIIITLNFLESHARLGVAASSSEFERIVAARHPTTMVQIRPSDTWGSPRFATDVQIEIESWFPRLSQARLLEF